MQTFDQLCQEQRVTRDEREALAHHLASFRYRETLKLIDPEIVRIVKANKPNTQGQPPQVG